MDNDLRSYLDDSVEEFYCIFKAGHADLALINNIVTSQELRYYAIYASIMDYICTSVAGSMRNYDMLADEDLRIIINKNIMEVFSEYNNETTSAIKEKIQRLDNIIRPYLRLDYQGYEIPSKN